METNCSAEKAALWQTAHARSGASVGIKKDISAAVKNQNPPSSMFGFCYIKSTWETNDKEQVAMTELLTLLSNRGLTPCSVEVEE